MTNLNSRLSKLEGRFIREQAVKEYATLPDPFRMASNADLREIIETSGKIPNRLLAKIDLPVLERRSKLERIIGGRN